MQTFLSKQLPIRLPLKMFLDIQMKTFDDTLLWLKDALRNVREANIEHQNIQLQM